MVEDVRDFWATKGAGCELLVELILSSNDAVRPNTVRRFLEYLSRESRHAKLEAVDLNSIFEIIVFGSFLLVIPRPAFASNDLLVIKHFNHPDGFTAERFEFHKDNFYVDPNVYLPGYLRNCVSRAIRRGFRED